MVFIYNIILRTTMGNKDGSFIVFINGDYSVAVLNILGHTNILMGSFSKVNQRLVLMGEIRTYMGPLKCTCEAVLEELQVLGMIKTKRGDIPFRGSEVKTGGEENE